MLVGLSACLSTREATPGWEDWVYSRSPSRLFHSRACRMYPVLLKVFKENCADLELSMTELLCLSHRFLSSTPRDHASKGLRRGLSICISQGFTSDSDALPELRRNEFGGKCRESLLMKRSSMTPADRRNSTG